jgi:hypothetical protein
MKLSSPKPLDFKACTFTTTPTTADCILDLNCALQVVLVEFEPKSIQSQKFTAFHILNTTVGNGTTVVESCKACKEKCVSLITFMDPVSNLTYSKTSNSSLESCQHVWFAVTAILQQHNQQIAMSDEAANNQLSQNLTVNVDSFGDTWHFATNLLKKSDKRFAVFIDSMGSMNIFLKNIVDGTLECKSSSCSHRKKSACDHLRKHQSKVKDACSKTENTHDKSLFNTYSFGVKKYKFNELTRISQHETAEIFFAFDITKPLTANNENCETCGFELHAIMKNVFTCFPKLSNMKIEIQKCQKHGCKKEYTFNNVKLGIINIENLFLIPVYVFKK